ncbi:MAG: hypothetical protein GTO04_10470 [Planctomycetales bacterium]|nr:hypothetical protein [Planctomycetales bacterium]
MSHLMVVQPMPRFLLFLAALLSLAGCAEEDGIPPEIERKAAQMGDPLLRAIEENQVEGVIEALQNGADPNVAQEGKLPPLHLAASLGFVEVAEALIKRRADVNLMSTYSSQGPDGEVQTRPGRTALHMAITGNHLEVAQLLIQHNAQVNTKNAHGMTPLDLATSKGNFLEQLQAKETEPERLSSLTNDMSVNQSISQLLKENGAKTSTEIEAADLDQLLQEDESGGIMGRLNASLERIKNKQAQAEEANAELDIPKTFPKEVLDKIGPLNLDQIDQPAADEPKEVDDFLQAPPDS